MMLDVIARLITKQEAKVAKLKAARLDVTIEHTKGRSTSGCISVGETEAFYELQGMKKIYNACGGGK